MNALDHLNELKHEIFDIETMEAVKSRIAAIDGVVSYHYVALDRGASQLASRVGSSKEDVEAISIIDRLYAKQIDNVSNSRDNDRVMVKAIEMQPKVSEKIRVVTSILQTMRKSMSVIYEAIEEVRSVVMNTTGKEARELLNDYIKHLNTCRATFEPVIDTCSTANENFFDLEDLLWAIINEV